MWKGDKSQPHFTYWQRLLPTTLGLRDGGIDYNEQQEAK
jgi:hypothetical protein